MVIRKNIRYTELPGSNPHFGPIRVIEGPAEEFPVSHHVRGYEITFEDEDGIHTETLSMTTDLDDGRVRGFLKTKKVPKSPAPVIQFSARARLETRVCWDCGCHFTRPEARRNGGDWADSYCGQ